jgi:CheY-like chemotaxis protein
MILVVDDDLAFAENCAMLLESFDYEVSVAFSGIEALSKIKSLEPNLLIADCCMPGLTGLELCEQVKQAPRSARLPILLMSGSMQCDVAKGGNYDAFIKKPFLAEGLLINVRKLLELHAGSPNGIKQEIN